MAWQHYHNITKYTGNPISFDYSRYRYRIHKDTPGGAIIYVSATGRTHFLSSGQTLALDNSIAPNNTTMSHTEPVDVPIEREPLASPTVPSSISVSGSMLVGNTATVSWGASSDPAGNAIAYTLEVARNGGSFTTLFNTASRSYGYLIPAGTTSLTFRVLARATDTSGNTLASSGYRTSTVYNVSTNSAPTVPGAFTQPTGELEIGDSKVFSVGASSDTEGNLSKYIWEASINGGAYTKIGETTTPSLTYTIPTATSLKMRVKSVDATGLESPYRDSAIFTVTKPKYYWSKYNVNTTITYSDNAPWESRGEGTSFWDNNYKSYSFNSTTNTYSLTGGLWSGEIPNGAYGYYLSGSELRRNVAPWGGHTTIGNDTVRYYKDPAKNTRNTTYSRGSLAQSNLIAEETTYPNNTRHTDGYWYVRGSRVNQTIAPPAPFTVPTTGAILEPKQALTLTFGASAASAISTYEVQHRYNGGAWQNVGTHINALTRAFTVTEDKTLTTVEFRVRAKNTSGVYSDYVYSEAFVIQHNKIPTVTLETENNKTLYEKDTFVIKGSALEPDIGDVLIVYYRINGGQARGFATKVSDGTSVAFNEQLTFQSGKLYKGETEITDALSDGTPHTLEVWAEDNQGGKSVIETRTFYVVPNRPPSLTIDPIEDVSGMIDADKITITGTSFDADGNDVIVRYRINNGINVEIHNGLAGEFSFDIPVSKLKEGENAIVVEVSDTYDFKASKTIKLNLTAVITPLASSVMRYTIVPPSGSAQRLSLWIERDETQDVTVEISMTNGTEPENFARMIWNDEDSRPDPEPAPIAPGIVEDFWKYKADAPAEHIAIKISWTGDKPIFKVTGAFMQ